MKKYARIINGVAVDVTDAPSEHFHPEIAAEFVEVPDVVIVGSHHDAVSGNWLAPVQPEPELPVTPSTGRIIGPNEFYFLWTIQEQLAIDALRQSDKVVELFMRRLDDPRTYEVALGSQAVQAAVAHTVQKLVEGGTVAANKADQRIQEILNAQEPA